MSVADRDTIFALSSGRPPAAIAVVRVSGPRARFGLETLIGRVPEPRRAALGKVRDPKSGDIIDEALVLWFPGPHSETGEDTAELQLHGGRAVIAAVLTALGEIDGFRPAVAGEFTRRAFENGRLDLTAVEGLADLIDAETDAQRRQAFRQLKGLLGDRAEGWRQRLIEALALVEVSLDFSDEGDVPQDTVGPALAIARALRDEIEAVLTDGRRGERVRGGLTVAIAGPPNAGKSSLLNALVRRDVAIVSPYPGTTRDVIEVHLDLDGYPVTVLDTAGVRESTDPVEQEGVRRAQARAAAADLVLWVTEAADPVSPPLIAAEAAIQTSGAESRSPLSRGRADEESRASSGERQIWHIFNKIDLIDSARERFLMAEPGDKCPHPYPRFALSVERGIGVANLISKLSAFAGGMLGGAEPALVTRSRQRQALERAVQVLSQSLEIDSSHGDLVAEELRIAARHLGALVGRIDVEQVLDAIFRDFCIGK